MNKGFGLSGAHRTGKTSICQELETLSKGGVVFVPTTTSQIAEEMGFDTTKQHSFDDRMTFQWNVLISLTKVWGEAATGNDTWVTDRTPLDLIAYTLIDSHSWEFLKEYKEELEEYKDACLSVSSKLFNHVFLLPTDGVIMEGEEANKGKNNVFYQEHLDLLYRGLTTELSGVTIIRDRSYFGKRAELHSYFTDWM